MNTYLDYQLIAKDLARSLDRTSKQPVVSRETKYYLDNIGKVKSIDDFLKNDRLFKYAMKAFGLEDMAYAKAFMKKALTEGIDKSDSFANRLSDKRYAEFVKAFNFVRYGDLATSYNSAQHDVPKNFNLQIGLTYTQQGLDFADSEVSYYIGKISSVKSIDDLMADSRLLNIALGAFGLDAKTETPARIREMLEGGISDPNSPANKLGDLGDKRYANLVAAFDFAKYGADTTAQDAVQTIVPKQFLANAGLNTIIPRAEYTKAESDYYAANIGKVKSIDDLLADKRLLRAAMSAYGLDVDAQSPKQIREMLEGGVTDPNSPANKLPDKRYAAFVTAFNFVQYGEGTTARDAVQKDTLKLYTTKSQLGLIKPGSDYVAAEAAYYAANVVKLRSIDDLMADKRLLNYALTAYGLDPAKETPARIRQMLEGGITNPNSSVNKSGSKPYVAFVTAFNFAQYGEKATTRSLAQQPATDNYVRQTLEQDAGQTNDGVRLALYFQRKAPALNNWYQVLGDKAMAAVVRTALGLPESMAKADVDMQVRAFEQKLKITDFADPVKLAKFLTRFTTMYELNNPSSPQASAVSVLFPRPTTAGVSTDLLFTMQRLKF
nr:DUF1217 domain-containing protein [Mesorhizobium loti]